VTATLRGVLLTTSPGEGRTRTWLTLAAPGAVRE